MIKVGICNVDNEQIAHIELMMKDILSRYDRWTMVRYTQDSLRQAVTEHTFACELLILDIFESDEWASDIVEDIESGDINTNIIYITESQSKVMSCYRNRAYAYILKPLHDSDMRREITRYFKERNIQQRCLRITFGGTESYIPLDSIQYIESSHRKVFIYTQNDKRYEYYSRLDVLEEELSGGNFVRCHQSFLISVPHISDYMGNAVMIGDKSIPVSRKYRALVQNVLYQAELSDECKTEKFVQAGTHKLMDSKGALICIKGEYMGKIVRMVPEQTVIIGRSGDTADVVVNLPQVSRVHCRITYHAEGDYYEVQDCSLNGTFLEGKDRLVRGNVYAVKPGTGIVFGEDTYAYRLG